MSKVSNWAMGIKSEWKRIVWPSKKDLTKKTGAVIGVSAVLGCAIVVMDMAFQNGINYIVGLF